ncbi:hypothetical protein M3Y99_01335700 [Aphelenchoides fujianensis]|nr:hypothetical protein M3Y99_01335700 [Aphelenchoides fujianensis]
MLQETRRFQRAVVRRAPAVLPGRPLTRSAAKRDRIKVNEPPKTSHFWIVAHEKRSSLFIQRAFKRKLRVRNFAATIADLQTFVAEKRGILNAVFQVQGTNVRDALATPTTLGVQNDGAVIILSGEIPSRRLAPIRPLPRSAYARTLKNGIAKNIRSDPSGSKGRSKKRPISSARPINDAVVPPTKSCRGLLVERIIVPTVRTSSSRGARCSVKEWNSCDLPPVRDFHSPASSLSADSSDSFELQTSAARGHRSPLPSVLTDISEVANGPAGHVNGPKADSVATRTRSRTAPNRRLFVAGNSTAQMPPKNYVPLRERRAY